MMKKLVGLHWEKWFKPKLPVSAPRFEVLEVYPIDPRQNGGYEWEARYNWRGDTRLARACYGAILWYRYPHGYNLPNDCMNELEDAVRSYKMLKNIC